MNDILRQQEMEVARLDAATYWRRGCVRQVAANLPVRRSLGEGGKELGYGG